MLNFRGRRAAEKIKNEYFDLNLIAVIVLLLGFGLVMLYSTSAYSAEIRFKDDLYYFRKQGLIALASLFMAVVASFIDYHFLWKISSLFYVFSFCVILLVLSPLGKEINYARRWVNIAGLQFQPSEFAKLAVIILVPQVIIKMGKNFRGFKATAAAFLPGIVLALETYLITENLSTAIIILGITAVIIFIAHPKTWPFIAALFGVAVFALLIILFVKNSDAAHESFRFRRILVWLNPELYPREGGYQTMQALYALGSGGFFGKGLGNSTQKLGFVPEAENDMIFSIICEELGVFGGIIVLILFGYLLYRLFFIAQNAKDLYGSLIAAGVFGHIMLQVTLNICVVLNVIPTTGITLPFISYGGTSVVFLMAEMALALMVSRQIPVKRQERDLWGDIVSDYDY